MKAAQLVTGPEVALCQICQAEADLVLVVEVHPHQSIQDVTGAMSEVASSPHLHQHRQHSAADDHLWEQEELVLWVADSGKEIHRLAVMQTVTGPLHAAADSRHLCLPRHRLQQIEGDSVEWSARPATMIPEIGELERAQLHRVSFISMKRHGLFFIITLLTRSLPSRSF